MNRLIVLASLAILMFGTAQIAQANPITYVANLSGPAESPPNASPGTGFATVTFDLAHHLMTVNVSFTGLLGTTTASHIHSPTAVPFAGTAGVATQTPTFSGFPLGVTSGTYFNTFDTSLAVTWNPAFVTANGTVADAEAAFAAALANGTAYLNIHTTVVPGGEIRGFLVPVPEPTTILLLGTGLAAIASRIRRKRKEMES